MSAVVSALDMHTPASYGENGHYQHTWSNSLKEKILQLSFQLTRSSKEHVTGELASGVRDILSDIGGSDQKSHFLDVIMRLICHTRDIVCGKGEYHLAYMMVFELYAFHPAAAERLVEAFVLSPDGEHQLGSMKDIKNICNYCRERCGESHPLIDYCISLCLKQIRKDSAAYVSKSWAEDKSPKISLAARWVPREKHRASGWLFRRMAETYNNHFIVSAKSPEALIRARNKAWMSFRKTCSDLNRYLDTPQIKQCDGRWADINFACLTSITTRRQNKALRNVDSKGNTRSDLPDRKECASKFVKHIESLGKDGKEAKGKQVSLIELVRDAFALKHNTDNCGKTLLNSQWRDNSAATGDLPNMVAMVDTSGSMHCDGMVPLHSAIGLGCRIAEKSKLGRRVMTFSSQPRWVNLDECPNLTDMVWKIASTSDWGFNTNFTAALEVILDAICARKLPPSDVEDMVLVILSDMQIDESGNEEINETMLDGIRRMYKEAGEKAVGAPYHPPHILFWNLRSTDGFPSLSSSNGCSMMSGASPSLLRVFCEKGVAALRETTPWSMLMELLDNPRYVRAVSK